MRSVNFFLEMKIGRRDLTRDSVGPGLTEGSPARLNHNIFLCQVVIKSRTSAMGATPPVIIDCGMVPRQDRNPNFVVNAGI